MTGPGMMYDPNRDAEFEEDDEQDIDQDDGAYGADDDWPADVCHNLYDGN